MSCELTGLFLLLTFELNSFKVSEEVAGAARAPPYAILIGVAGTASLGWILLIAASFATASVSDVFSSTLPLPMAQLFLDVLGKKGMLIIWSFIIVVQVCIPFMIARRHLANKYFI